MARTSSGLTAIQQDDKLFGEVCDKIRKVTPYKLANYGLVSYTTIYNYMNRIAVAPRTEPGIKESFRLYEAEKAMRDEQSIQDMKELVK